MAIKDLSRLGSAEAENILDKVKNNGAIPISFTFHIHSSAVTPEDGFSGEGPPTESLEIARSNSQLVAELGDREALCDSGDCFSVVIVVWFCSIFLTS